MKKLLGILAVSAIGVAAWFSDVEKQDIPHVNILGGVNPGFENSTSKWSKTGSSTLAATTANVAYGVAAAEWDASATGEFLRSADVAVPKGLEGRACLMEFEYWLTGGSAGDVVVRVETDGGDALTSDLSLAVNGKYAKAQLGFICPTADSIRIEFESTANASVLRVDQAYLGRDHRLGETIQSTDWVVATDADDKPTISNISATLSSSKYRRIGDTIDMITQFSVSGAATGNITITAPVNFPVNTTIANGGQVVGQIRGRDDNGGSTTIEYHGFLWVTGGNNFSARGPNGQDTWNATLPFTWASSDSIYVRWSYPVSSWAGSGTNNVTLETQGWHLEGAIYGLNVGVGTGSQSYAAVTNSASLQMELFGKSASAQIACTSAVSTGLTCAGNQDIGLTVEIPYAGDFMLCSDHGQRIRGTTSDFGYVSFKWAQTNEANNTILQDGDAPSRAGFVFESGNNSYLVQQHKVCEIFNFTSAGRKTFRLFLAQSTGGPLNENNMMIDNSTGTGGNRRFNFKMFPLTQNMPQAVALTEATATIPGSVKLPYDRSDLPAFSSYRSTAQTFVGGTNFIIFNSERFDNGGVYDITNGKFTAPVDGIYQFNVGYGLNTSSGTGRLQLGLDVVGNTLSGAGLIFFDKDINFDTDRRNRAYSGMLELSAGTEVRVYAFVGGTVPTTDHPNVWFQGHLVAGSPSGRR